MAAAEQVIADTGAQLREALRDAASSRERVGHAEAASSHAGRAQVEAAAREQAERDRAGDVLTSLDAERAEAARLAAACRVETEGWAGAEAALNRVLSSGTWRATRPLRTGMS